MPAVSSPSNQINTTNYNKPIEEIDDTKFSRNKSMNSENKIPCYDEKYAKENFYNINSNKSIFPKIIKKGKELITHTIIDYSINKSDFIGSDILHSNDVKNLKNDYTNNNTSNSNENSNSNKNLNYKKKLDIKNEKIKNLLEKSKQKGSYAPYFSLCKNCNERNNEFYNQIDLKNAMGIIKIIDKEEKITHKFDKF